MSLYRKMQIQKCAVFTIQKWQHFEQQILWDYFTR